MTARVGVTVLALPPSALENRPVATLEDLASTREPDAVWVLGPSREPQAFARARSVFEVAVFHPPLETTGDGPLQRQPLEGGENEAIEERDALDLTVAPSLRAMDADRETASSTLARRSVDADSPPLICDDVTTTVRPTALAAELEGAKTLASVAPTGAVTTVLTGSEPAGYDALWHLEAESGSVRAVDHDPIGTVDPLDSESVSVRVRGAGPAEGYGESRSIATLKLDANGVSSVDTDDVTDFGLESVSGIGPKTATRLAERGVTTRTGLLEASLETLASLSGVGAERARTMHRHARVLETGEARRLTDESLPGEHWSTPPLCLDIETDGLSPTILWQIGVYDPAADEYRAFVEREDPSDPGPVLEAFCDWLLGVHPNRALLTWNGWGFDYRHLTSFVAKHAPYYAEEWESIPKFDLYWWAAKNEHALLPGRTNELGVVADAMGFDGAKTGLDGAQTAAAYQRFMRTGEPLEWERHEAYCEDDCRALWHVYERLQDAPRDDGASADESTTAPVTRDPATRDASRADSSEGGSDSSSAATATTEADETEQSGLSDF
ncbi:ribonuclease H-like domain-containing protein [Natronorubrum daqingense]|uniref:RecB family nuclease, putative, TM0106 family n=1 Tax=Natronorubrum daqingense TaxID=588898 RepID=A0A1N6XLU9_9EURY|nr:ribonuclease H-like domain-containing protein [Natronorubrum daqingense]APX95918.1 hypothetical protein BB347_04410 [Natronorubrum daqingense]SIR03270.1 RecB family nuclease, putative, TM0106 family [Natronorubrum daqingense]